MTPAQLDIAHALEVAASLSAHPFQQRPLLATPAAHGASHSRAASRPRSARRFTGGVSDSELTSILAATWSTTGSAPAYDVRDFPTFNQPSAGGLGGVEIRVLRARPGVEAAPGVYRWDPIAPALCSLRRVDTRPLVERTFPGQAWVAEAPDVVLIYARLDLLVGKYGVQGLRLAWIQVGIVTGALYESLPHDVGGCAIGGIALDELDDLPLDLPFGSTFGLAFAIGRRA